MRWCSRHGLTVHRCRREEVLEDGVAGGVGVFQGRVDCRECGRTFSTPGDLKRHKFLDERSKPPQEQQGSLQCPTCEEVVYTVQGVKCPQEKTPRQQQLNLLPPKEGPHDPKCTVDRQDRVCVSLSLCLYNHVHVWESICVY